MRDESQTSRYGRLPSRWVALIAVCALGFALTAIGCGSGNSGSQSTAGGGSSQEQGGSAASQPPSTAGGAEASGADKVDIVDFDYKPKTITVNAGDKVEFSNQDDAAHSATADDGSFDTKTLQKGDTAAVTLQKPGTYTYFCRFHAFMHGTIEVNEAAV